MQKLKSEATIPSNSILDSIYRQAQTIFRYDTDATTFGPSLALPNILHISNLVYAGRAPAVDVVLRARISRLFLIYPQSTTSSHGSC